MKNISSEEIMKLKNIDKSYGDKILTKVLNNINLTFYRGDFIAIIGESGSGKSTLLNLIGSLDKPTSGDIYFKEKNMAHYTLDEMAEFRNKNIGFIFQFHFLLPEFTVLENILMPTWIRSQKDTYELKNRALEILEYVGLKSFGNRKSGDLSGGQQQRVAIARALINNPDIVLADEPTGNLDSHSSSEIYDLLRKINKDLKTTIIIVTHDLRISNMCDRVIKISDGMIV